MLDLSPAFQRLGQRLLRRRCEPQPWHLGDDPANQRFIKRMGRLGIQLEPWLNPQQPVPKTAVNGTTLHLAFEHDPLEIFHMGGHFNTCLSPGDFNFFSVFANAADINKHVVYARNEQGQVVGRCLLALTDQGGVLAFEPYCHDKSLGFEAMMGELVTDLAEQMKTAVVVSGKVSPLVATDWYDDGPRDLNGRFAFLQHNSDFQKSLKRLTPAEFKNQLIDRFAPLPLNALTLTPVLQKASLQKHPQLILPLLPYIEASKGISEHLLLRAAYLAHRAGDANAAHRLIRNRAIPYLLEFHRRHHWLSPDLMQMLAELEPTSALRVLRQTRPRGVRNDEDESGKRRELLALAHEQLGRTIRAERLRQA